MYSPKTCFGIPSFYYKTIIHFSDLIHKDVSNVEPKIHIGGLQGVFEYIESV